jgi:acyl-coenzyme A thioesterase PaaI-like protein
MLESQWRSFRVDKAISSENAGEELRQYIAVRQPYYALSNITIARDGYLIADVPIEMKDHNEVPGISLSEAGRHVAILGTLALANENPRKEKHYYLATDAMFERTHPEAISEEGCKAIAKVVSLNRKEGVVHGRLYSKSNRLTYNAEVRYAVLHERIFERLFARYEMGTDSLFVGNPYALKTPLRIESHDNKQFTGVIDRVEKSDCAGHFHRFPALPVARIAGAMIDLSGRHYNRLRETDSLFCIRRVEMHAESFIFAGEKVHLNTHCKFGRRDQDTLIESFAHTGNTDNAVEMKSWFF